LLTYLIYNIMEGTLAEIRMFAGNFAPRGWQLCNGQLLSIAQWTAVFALVGTTYGGNGQTTFGVPDFRGRIAIGAQNAQGPGLPFVDLGEQAGVQSVTLLTTNLPIHTHPLTGTVNPQGNAGAAGLNNDPNGRRLAGTQIFTGAADDLQNMAAAASTLAVGPNGSSQPFSNMPPYLGMNYIFCVEGIFPSRD
jgi:microcystin-dependent protein